MFCEFDPANGNISVASFGHPPPLVVSSDAAKFLPLRPATPLGAGETGIEEWTGQLGREEILLLYTDGVIDNRASDLETQMAKLADLSIGSDSADDLCSRILAAMGRDRADDVALLALQAVAGSTPRRPVSGRPVLG